MELREDLVQLLAQQSEPEEAPVTSSDCAALERELAILRAEHERLERGKQQADLSAAKARESLSEAIAKRDEAMGAEKLWTKRALDFERQLGALKKQYAELERDLDRVKQESERGEEAGLRKALEQLRERFQELSHENAELRTVNRELGEQVEELESMLPRGKRERLRWKQNDAKPTIEGGAFLPCFGDGFLKTLSSFERNDELRIWHSIAQLLLYGSDLGGLHFKTLHVPGKLHSIRAASHLRIYFQRDGELLIFEHACHRNKQDEYLKRLREQ